ncbi:MAG: Uncharacterised protein [Cyanobium sp. ARS6]|nr:MAG: Uncharacterised protein [Cyanobium sp. ARS6]
MQGPDERIRNRGENRAGIHFTAITSQPAFPEASKPEGALIGAPDGTPFFKKATGRNQTAAMTPGTAETGFIRHRFRAGIERSGALGWILLPAGNETPEHQRRLRSRLIHAKPQQGLSWNNQVSGGITASMPRFHPVEQCFRQLIQGQRKGVTTTHLERI